MTAETRQGGVPAAGGTAPAEGFVLGRRPELDGLRGIAVLSVLAEHTVLAWAPGGFIGVDLFFVLSGFLITSLLLQERQAHNGIHLGQFYLRRVLRLAPALLALLALNWIFVLCVHTSNQAWHATALRKDTISILLYFYNWRMSYTMNLFHNPALGPVWSLSVEEQFYLFWPLLLSGLLALRDRHRGRWIVGLLLLGIIAPAVLRVVLWTGAESIPSLYMCTHTRLDGLSAGCLVSVLAARGLLRPATRWGRWGLQAVAWAAVAVLTVALFTVHNYDRLMYHGGFTVVSLCAAVLVAALVGSPPPLLSRLLGARPLRWVGRISYGLYLWHTPVIIAVLQFVPIADFTTKCLLAWVPCLAAGALSHYCVELPFLRLKDRLGRERPAVGPQPLLKAAA